MRSNEIFGQLGSNQTSFTCDFEFYLSWICISKIVTLHIFAQKLNLIRVNVKLATQLITLKMYMLEICSVFV